MFCFVFLPRKALLSCALICGLLCSLGAHTPNPQRECVCRYSRRSLHPGAAGRQALFVSNNSWLLRRLDFPVRAGRAVPGQGEGKLGAEPSNSSCNQSSQDETAPARSSDSHEEPGASFPVTSVIPAKGRAVAHPFKNQILSSS